MSAVRFENANLVYFQIHQKILLALDENEKLLKCHFYYILSINFVWGIISRIRKYGSYLFKINDLKILVLNICPYIQPE